MTIDDDEALIVMIVINRLLLLIFGSHNGFTVTFNKTGILHHNQCIQNLKKRNWLHFYNTEQTDV